jgi:hypothetical protein
MTMGTSEAYDLMLLVPRAAAFKAAFVRRCCEDNVRARWRLLRKNMAARARQTQFEFLQSVTCFN